MSMEHTIWVDERNKLENKVLSQRLCTEVIWFEDEIKKAIENKAGRSLTRMDPTSDDYDLEEKENVCERLYAIEISFNDGFGQLL